MWVLPVLALGCAARLSSSDRPPNAALPCVNAFDCPRAPGPCVVSTCVERVCVTVDAAEKTLVQSQTSGDCKLTVCDGRGGTMTLEDAADWPADDGNECTNEVCDGPKPDHPALERGTACGEGGVCNGAGKCGACLPGATRCNQNEPQACSDEGQWSSPGPCPEPSPVCSNAACVPLAEVATGYRHSCALFSDGAVRCWGDKRAGRLGDGFLASVASLSGVAELASGERHTCARLTSGAVRCWGRNDDGQLGDRSWQNRYEPASVEGLSDAVQIAAGAGHTCARTANGPVVCWGRNDKGQLGDGAVRSGPKPPAESDELEGGPSAPRPAAPVLGIGRVAALSLGADHTCALLPNRSVACWGDDTHGQLGHGATPKRTASSKAFPAPPPKPPAAVRNLRNATFIALGANHSCARLADGAVACWGDNTYGQLGDGTTTSRPSPVFVSGLSRAVGIALGRFHSCAWLDDGSARCWGRNASGQLGDGTTDDKKAPAQVATLTGVSRLTSRGDHTCAQLMSGAVRCWGENAAGQLGDNRTSDRPTPGPIAW